ncbi:MAG: exo-beta-N-acetylmuramidase NamZ domain-containing protein [Planctomycetaceae bacterium]
MNRVEGMSGRVEEGRTGNVVVVVNVRHRAWRQVVAACAALVICSNATWAGLPHAAPGEVGLDAARLARIDELVAEGLSEKKMPGCVVCIGRHGRIAFLKAYGNKQVEPDVVPMTTDTVFDMASITKPVATATSIMMLIERGQLRLADKVVAYIPEFAPHGKDAITIHQLLTHQSGLLPDNALKDYLQGPEVALQKICDLALQNPVGSKFVYSDVNFILLGEIIRRVSGQNVHEFTHAELFEPLGMSETGYLPSPSLQLRAAPTEQRDGQWMQGQVHDPRAWELGGVAGHSGLFSTADDLAIYAQMMLQQGRYSDRQVLAPQTIARMTRGDRVSSGIRGLGWDKWTGYSSNRGDLLTESAFGHGGFTGTVLWIDPQLDMFFVFLSNRVHPNGKGVVNSLAGRIATVAAASVQSHDDDVLPRAGAGEVLTGIDVLVRDGFRPLTGRKVGLITNHTGRSRDGRTTVELLHAANNLDLTALFSPEHGFAGQLDVSKVGDSQDAATGLKVFSLYGETRRPTAEMLENVDTLVFDIQDIGARFYTYVSTMGEAMQSAAEHRKRFVVLDRPNPINGVDVAGPMLDAGKESFIAFHSLPVQHGMTIGELARMFQEELKLDLDLEVIACEGWQRSQTWDETGLMWINPSPNMRSLTEALLYPGIGLLETTNISVGRGTDTPFEVLGAPWMDGLELAAALRGEGLPGVTFVPIEFTPDSSKFEHERCEGVNIAISDRARLEPVRIGLTIAAVLLRLYPKDWKPQGNLRLLGSAPVEQALVSGESAAALQDLSREGMNRFRERRAKFLLYE